jgi:hypothetical protein
MSVCLTKEDWRERQALDKKERGERQEWGHGITSVLWLHF